MPLPLRRSCVAVLLSLFAACGGADGNDLAAPDGRRNGAGATPAATAALPTTPIPTSNPTSSAKVALGRLLFWDPILSGDRDIACATCHHPSFAYTDGRARSIGTGGTGLGPRRIASATDPQITPRNSMTVLNTAFNGVTGTATGDPLQAPMFWDSRARSLEGQASGPISARGEMRGAHFGETTIFPEIVTRLTAIPEYVSRFTEAFDGAPIDQARIVDAIATWERTLVDHDSSYDRSRSGGPAMSAAAQRGERAFAASGCTHCHNGPMFSDFRLHRLGVPDLPGTPHDSGNGNDQFRTGSLRNISRTGPYMHNGVFNTIDEVFQFYRRVDRRLDPALDNVRPPQGNDAADVKAFFDALSDGTFDQSIPGTVPSGLPVGGAIN